MTTRHEATDIRARPILWAAAGLLVALTAIFALGSFVVPRSTSTGPTPFPPEPRLQITPENLRKEEDRRLSSYEWIDREKGIVRIPIDRAIDLQLQRGFPTKQ